MKLHQSPLSPNCKRVRAVAAELGIPLTLVNVDLAKGENRQSDYLAINPNGKVPTLVGDDGTVLWESPAILMHLALKKPEAGLLPTDAKNRVELERWMFWNASHLEESVFTVARQRVIRPLFGETPDEARSAEGIENFNRFAPIFNGHIEGKKWILNDQFTIADIALATTLELAVAAKIDLARYPHIRAWLSRVQARPAWQKASS